MMNRVLVILLAVSLVVNVAVATTFSYYWLGERSRGRRPSPPWVTGGPEVRPELLKRRLGLTDEQIEQIDAAREEKRKLMALADAEEVEQREVDGLLREIADLQVEIEKQMFKHFRELREILTPEQREHMFRMLESRLEPPVPDHPVPDRPFEGGMRTGPGPGGKQGGQHGGR
jgi:Spy/CpxP family protein refolding chaperone